MLNETAAQWRLEKGGEGAFTLSGQASSSGILASQVEGGGAGGSRP